MSTTYLAVTIATVAVNTFSGTVSLARPRFLAPAMARARVPESWLAFPIGVLKVAGATGLLLGLLGVPLIGIAAAIGLVLFYVCAVHTHLLAADYSRQLALSIGYLGLAVTTLVLGLLGPA